MKRIVSAAALLLTLFFFGRYVVSVSAADNANIAGHWSLVTDANGQALEIGCDIKQTGADFTGSTSSSLGAGTIDGGKVNGKAFSATLHSDIQGTSVDFKMEGTADGDKMTGTFVSGNLGTFSFTGTRSK